MQQPPIMKHRLRTLASLLAFGGLLVAQQAAAHGYSSDPPSRAFMCHGSYKGPKHNTGCGAAQYDYMSLENHTSLEPRFPVTGPIDEGIPGASDGKDDTQYSALNDQTATLWEKTDLTAGENHTFVWTFTAVHPTKDISYFITKKDWNPNEKLTRASFEEKPFCQQSFGGQNPDAKRDADGHNNISTTCAVPGDRTGYHVILGVWNVADPANNAFISTMDVNLVKSGPTPPEPTWQQVGNINPSQDLAVGDQVSTRVFAPGETSALGTSITINSVTDGDHNRWPYLLAQQINKTRGKSYEAGQMHDDVINPVLGQNSIFANKGSGIKDVEIEVKHKPTPPVQDMKVTVDTEYSIDNGSAVVKPFVSLTKKATVTATLLNSTTQVGTNTAVVDSAATIPVNVNNAVAGNFTLVVKTDGADQQSFPIKLTGGSSGGLPTWDASATYQWNQKVQWKGRSYVAAFYSMGKEPGNPAFTGPDGSGKEWKDQGPASK
jgi:predicted carbohydrate-binding protein with CBM5 and CBM33 domain